MWKEDKEMARQEEILQAAIKVLSKQGFQQTKIKDIAQEAGVADGTIYLYFKNKDELLVQLFEGVMKRVLEILRGALVDYTKPEERLRCFLRTHLHMVEEEPEIAKIISVVLRQSTTFIQEYENTLFTEYLGLLYEILQQGIVEGVFRADIDPVVTSRALFGAADELALAWLLSRHKIPLERTSEVLANMVLYGLCD